MSIGVRLLIALLLAFILTIIPLPVFLSEMRPSWILLLVLCIQFFFPTYFHVVLLLIIGICFDVLLTTVTGQHAFALLLTTWISSTKARRFRFYTMGQQIGLIGLFGLIYEGTLFVIDAFLGYHAEPIRILSATLSAIVFWPCIVLFAHSTLRGTSLKKNSFYV